MTDLEKKKEEAWKDHFYDIDANEVFNKAFDVGVKAEKDRILEIMKYFHVSFNDLEKLYNERMKLFPEENSEKEY